MERGAGGAEGRWAGAHGSGVARRRRGSGPVRAGRRPRGPSARAARHGSAARPARDAPRPRRTERARRHGRTAFQAEPAVLERGDRATHGCGRPGWRRQTPPGWDSGAGAPAAHPSDRTGRAGRSPAGRRPGPSEHPAGGGGATHGLAGSPAAPGCSEPQILRKLLVGRIVFRRRENGVYEFSGQASLGRILAGIVCTKAGMAPTGFEPVLEWRPHFRLTGRTVTS